MEAKDLFKKLVKDAQRKFDPSEEDSSIMSYGSQRRSWFEPKKTKRDTDGKYVYLTDAFIDGLNDHDLEVEMVRFIYDCFTQR